MADIRINALPNEPTPNGADFLAIDGATTRKTTITAATLAGRPTASQAEAEAGVEATHAMTPLTTKQAIAFQGNNLYVPLARTVTPGSGLTGGGALSSNIVLSVNYTQVQAFSTKLTNIDAISYQNGDFIYATSPTTFNRLPIGSTGQVLQIVGGVPTWQSAPGTGDVVGPAVSVNKNISVMSGTTGKLIADAGVSISQITGSRNFIINGDFDIWQRGTSQTSTGYGSDDRWANNNTGSTKVASQQLHTLGQTSVPGNPKYFARTVVTSVANAANFVQKTQAIEGVQNFSGQSVTVTFWAKADASKNIAIGFTQFFGTGGSPSADVTGIGAQLIPLTTAWTKFTRVISIPSISGKTLGTSNSDKLQLMFWFDAGSSFNAQTASLGQQSGTFDISHVSVVSGNATTEDDPFSPVPVAQTLQLCLRYCRYMSSADQNFTQFAAGAYTTTTTAVFPFIHQPPLRAAPSFTSSAATTFSGTGITQAVSSRWGSRVDLSGFTASTVGFAAIMQANATASAFVQFDAEI